ncbi:ribonuclease H2, subunit C [Lactarius quietus]|nr:ribonuclease H2, subunit C [Lactarius quietus]
MATATRIAHCLAVPPVRVPHLMPFHIQHSGPAPVSTYFRVQPAPLPDSHPCPPSVAVETQLVSVASTVVEYPDEKENAPTVSAAVAATALATTTAEINAETDPVIKPPSSQLFRPGPIERLSGSAKRFISSFRGRTVHGVEVPMPKGYSGIVLRGEAEGRAQTTTSSKAKRQSARKPRRPPPEEVPEDDDMEGILPPEEERPVRVLKPSARFDSFVLWHPDVPVDEGMDEYLRSLSEWVNIASEIHQSEPLPT